MAEYDQLLMNPAAVSDHLLAPGHAPLARNGRSPLGALEVPVPHMDATNTGAFADMLRRILSQDLLFCPVVLPQLLKVHTSVWVAMGASRVCV